MSEEQSPISQHSNLLHESASSYLRSAAHQPVAWHPWNDAALIRAQHENKPILLDIGAVWCHWCHVMDRESYEDAEIAAILNENFVAIKVDRDERPDIDVRYQAAIAALSGQGGWPLTVFLTPDGRPYYGGTYFPREDGFGRPGFARVLKAMAEVWRDRREEAIEMAASVIAAIEHNESFVGQSGTLRQQLVDKLVASTIKQFDAQNGGFGLHPKFPHSAGLDLLLAIAGSVDTIRAHQAEAGKAFAVTLEKMRLGGIYDQLAGGFHRYSVDERWRVPHFEKMLYDNTELLRNYAHGFQSYSREEFRQTAQEIVGWLDQTMTDRERGGFFASQDADIHLNDDGDYFTWTLDEVRAVLADEELEFAVRYWGIREVGDMHHNPAKNVLHVAQTLEEIAAQSGQSLERIPALRDSARSKLLAARAERPTPFIDRTLYTGWNAMAVTAYLETERILWIEGVRSFALKTLDRLLSDAWDGAKKLYHVIAYGLPQTEAASQSKRVAATLDDYAFTVHACVDGWLASGEMRYYRAALALADAMIRLFYDRKAGAFFDTASSTECAAPLGALKARRKPIQDSPTPSGNATAASALLRLGSLSGRREFRLLAEETLGAFGGIVEHFGLFAGSYGLALERLLLDPVQVIILGTGSDADCLESIALGRFAVHKTVIRLAPAQIVRGELPESLEQTLLSLPSMPEAPAWALVCRHHSCLPPITTPEELLEALLDTTARLEI